ncbi:MAG: electron transfer flavoprotein subunit alpha [Candidatus Riflebacteria bacterium HGW-Riflebacteria-1]|jgi:electron transfer flavoprotein alpha subunit|nr:MAG: electron transfer flavoprotein subunit alpha [Candidatus Riflebacteria bacterium HGW-Riflebacteria-1]
MSNIKILPFTGQNIAELIALCPFNAIERAGDSVEINSGCRMCRICIKRRPDIFMLAEPPRKVAVNKQEWQGIAVYVEHLDSVVHPVSLELIGKARELAGKTGQQVFCLLVGDRVKSLTGQLLEYGVDKVFVYDQPELAQFKIEPFTAVFEDFINRVKPSGILVGGTSIGRSLAPRVAARFRTGLTADCTILDINPNTDIDQIRPAYGGNIMAHIHTPHHRPQFATVRYKIFNAPEKTLPTGLVEHCQVDASRLHSAIEVLEIRPKEKVRSIEDAETIIVAGKGLKKEADLQMIYDLADALDAMTAGTRPLIEQGWFDPRLQIGLSGRTVKPKLIITCGVSGSVQFAAGMQSAENIIAINNDPRAAIFDVAHYAVIGDLYQVIPALLDKIKRGGSLS